MSDITVRPYEDRDEEGYYGVRSLTYNDGNPVPAERRVNLYGNRFVAETAGQIAGVFNTLDMTATRGEALFRCAGVAGVGVSPDQRRGGVGLQMMNWSVNHFRETGFPLASLYAFREPFYGKSGYVVCGKRLRIKVPTHRLPKVDCKLPIRRLTPADWRELHPCYTKFAHQRSGANVRSEAMWHRVLAEIKPLTIYAAGDPVEGYVAVSHQVAFWEEQWLSEVAWSSREGYEACLSVMHQVGINKTSLAWFEPSDSPFYARYLDQGVEAELSRPVMFRVCDVRAALAGLMPKDSGSFTIEVQDPQVAVNNTGFKVSFSPGMVEVDAHTGSADVKMPISIFTQAFMGQPSLGELARFGSIEVKSDTGLAAASKLLPGLPVYCGDFF